MLTRHNLIEMLYLQSHINAGVNPDWRAARFPFLRAAGLACAEGADYYGGTGGALATADKAHLKMKLVDTWHFLLSHWLTSAGGDADTAADQVLVDLTLEDSQPVELDDIEFHLDAMDTGRRLELMMGLAVVRRTNVYLFQTLLRDVGMSWTDLFLFYVGENTLNLFRQDAGYQTGGYQKTWSGREDHEHLTELLLQVDPNAADVAARLYEALNTRYAECGGQLPT